MKPYVDPIQTIALLCGQMRGWAKDLDNGDLFGVIKGLLDVAKDVEKDFDIEVDEEA